MSHVQNFVDFAAYAGLRRGPCERAAKRCPSLAMCGREREARPLLSSTGLLQPYIMVGRLPFQRAPPEQYCLDWVWLLCKNHLSQCCKGGWMPICRQLQPYLMCLQPPPIAAHELTSGPTMTKRSKIRSGHHATSSRNSTCSVITISVSCFDCLQHCAVRSASPSQK